MAQVSGFMKLVLSFVLCQSNKFWLLNCMTHSLSKVIEVAKRFCFCAVISNQKFSRCTEL
jgi:hypothetical protein